VTVLELGLGAGMKLGHMPKAKPSYAPPLPVSR
jgi:hypothetical protein